jgi:hypothetical protein
MNNYIYIYTTCLKDDWFKLRYLPVLTVNQIKVIDNDCIRMYLYCYYNYSEFYNYKKKKLLNRYINKYKDNLMLLNSFLGRINGVKYLESQNLNIHHVNSVNMNAYLCACRANNIELIRYLERKNINIYQKYNGMNAVQLLSYNTRYNPKDGLSRLHLYLVNKYTYVKHSKICIICYNYNNSKNDKFITCKNNHIVHLICQAEKDRYRCLMCSAKYLI